MNNYKLLGASFGLGAKIKDTEQAPQVIFKLLNDNFSKELVIPESIAINLPQDKFRLPQLLEYYTKLADKITELMSVENNFLITIGGDHSIAIATWSSIITSLNAHQDFGLLWIDAHLDSHTYETSPSKAFHGMPLAALLGHGEQSLVSFCSPYTKLNPNHVVVFGARSYENDEHELLKKLGVKIIYAEEIHQSSLKEKLIEARNIINKASHGYGVSIDLDFFDPKFAPGVGSPVDNGFNPHEFVGAFNILKTENLKALEIVEFNPARDVNGKTAQIALDIISEMIKS